MADAELVVGSESTTSKVDHLWKAVAELESHRNSFSHETTRWKDIREHFSILEKSLKAKLDELEEKERTFKEKQSETQKLLVEKEEDVAAKERALLDRLQEKKDAAVSAITEARNNCKVDLPVPVDIGVSVENKVSTTANGDSNAPIPAPEKVPDNRSGEPTVAVAAKEMMPRPLLRQACEQMDSKGLLKFISDNKKHNVLRREITTALKSASEPARLVLDVLEGFYPPNQPTSEKDAALLALQTNCLFLMESAIPILGITEPDGVNPVNSETKQQAKAIADLWNLKLAAMDLDASNGYSLEAQAFLQLAVAFGIASDFDEDELCKLVLAVSRRRQATELCRSLGLAHKAPGLVEALVNSKRPLDAVNFAYDFQLTESFAAAPLLKEFLNDLGLSRKELSGDTGAAGVQDELSLLRAVIRCIEEYKLQEDYHLAPLQKRVAQLKKTRTATGVPEPTKVYPKKPRVNAGFVPRKPTAFVTDRQYPHTVFDDRGLYGVATERYPYVAPKYEAPPVHAQQASFQISYNYPAERVQPPASYSAPNYGSFMGSSLQSSSAIANQGNYTGSGYQPAQSNYESYTSSGLPPKGIANQGVYSGSGYQPPQSNYESYTGSGLPSSHQSYM